MSWAFFGEDGRIYRRCLFSFNLPQSIRRYQKQVKNGVYVNWFHISLSRYSIYATVSFRILVFRGLHYKLLL